MRRINYYPRPRYVNQGTLRQEYLDGRRYFRSRGYYTHKQRRSRRIVCWLTGFNEPRSRWF